MTSESKPREFWVDIEDPLVDASTYSCYSHEITDCLHVISYEAYQAAIERAERAENKLEDYKFQTKHAVEMWRKMAESAVRELEWFHDNCEDCDLIAANDLIKKYDEMSAESETKGE